MNDEEEVVNIDPKNTLEESIFIALVRNLNAFPNNIEAALQMTANEVSMEQPVTIEEVRKKYHEVMLYE